MIYDAYGFKYGRDRFCSFACRIDKANRVPRELTAAVLRDLLDYDQRTGRFIWRERRVRPGLERSDKGWNTRLAGKEPAWRVHRHGHHYIGIEYKSYAAHRLAWLYVYGEWPVSDIDHINGRPADNRIVNLRLATDSENIRNQRRRIDNTSGHKGVSWSKKSCKWYAYINVGGKMIALGLFPRKEDAISARRLAAFEYFGDFAREG